MQDCLLLTRGNPSSNSLYSRLLIIKHCLFLKYKIKFFVKFVRKLYIKFFSTTHDTTEYFFCSLARRPLALLNKVLSVFIAAIQNEVGAEKCLSNWLPFYPKMYNSVVSHTYFCLYSTHKNADCGGLDGVGKDIPWFCRGLEWYGCMYA